MDDGTGQPAAGVRGWPCADRLGRLGERFGGARSAIVTARKRLILAFNASEDRGRQAVAEMNLILDAIRGRDPRRARDAATAHVVRVAAIAAQLLRQSGARQSAIEASESAGCTTF